MICLPKGLINDKPDENDKHYTKKDRLTRRITISGMKIPQAIMCLSGRKEDLCA